jgi:mRNA-degrading endonuclease RelE of RelBE toxin-antitoxin system
MEAAPMTVVETPFFLRKAAGLLTDDERDQITAFVGANPEAGDIIPESGGVRKLRWAAKGKGRNGGVRIIYYFHTKRFLFSY